ncbi:MAG: hypothetical protein R3C05_20740 [Pirellulaceae bacterium]
MMRFISAVLLCWTSIAAFAVEPADRFPKQTCLFVAISNYKTFEEKLGTTSIGRLWSSESMQAFRKEFDERQQGVLGQLRSAYGIDSNLLHQHADGGFVVGGVKTSDDEISLTFLIELESASAKAMMATAGKNLKDIGATRSQTEFPIDATIYQMPDGQQVVHAVHDGYLLISGDVAVAKEMIDRWGKQAKDESLSSLPSFQAIAATPPRDGDADLFWFADVIQIAVLSDDAETKQALAADGRDPFPMRHGFPGIKAMGGYGFLKEDGFDFLNDIQVFAPKPRVAALQALDFVTGDLTPPPFVLSTGNNMMVNRWNLTSLISNLGDVYDDVTDAPGAWEATLADWKSDLGFDLIGGLLPMLQSEVVSYGDFLDDNRQERTLISIPIDNPKAQEIRVASLIYRFLRGDSNAVRSRIPPHRYDLWEIAMQDKLGNATFTRAGVMVADGRLWLATHASMIRDALLQGGETPLANSSVYSDMQDRMKAWKGERSFMQGLVHGDRDIRNTYETLRADGLEGLRRAESLYGNALLMLLGGDDDKPQPTTDFSKLPPFEEVREYFGMLANVGNITDHGWTIVVGAYDRPE